MTDAHIESIKKYAGELQNVGVIGDEVALAGVQQLGSYQLQAKTLKMLMPGMEDLLVQQKGLNATTGDAVTIGNMLGKVMTGQVGALSKAGINFTKAQERVLKYGNEQQKAAVLAKVLQQNVGGVNKAMAATDQGQIQQMTNAWGDLKEEVGKKLLPILAKVSNWFYKRIPAIQDYILKTMDAVVAGVERIKPYLIKISEIAGSLWDRAKPAVMEFLDVLGSAIGGAIDILEVLKNNWDRLSPAVYTLTDAIIAYNVAMGVKKGLDIIELGMFKAKAAWNTIQLIATGKLTIAQWALNAAMSANPIGAVIAAIAILVGAIWMCYKNFDKVKGAVVSLWDKLKGFWADLDKNPFGKVVKFLIKWFTPIGAIISTFMLLKKVIMGNMDFIKGAINTAISFVMGVFDSFKESLAKVKEMFGLLGEGILKLVDFLENAFTNALNAILHPIDTVKNAFNGILDKLKIWNNTEPESKNLEVNTTQNTDSTNTVTTIPRHALGTAYFKGGVTGINEGGRGETAVLPAGTQIMSHEQGKNANNSTKVEVNVTVQGNVIGNKEFLEETGQYIANRIKLSLSNI